MKKIIISIFLLIITILMLIFISNNQAIIEVNFSPFWLGTSYGKVKLPLAICLLLALILGFILGSAISLFNIIHYKYKIHKIVKFNKKINSMQIDNPNNEY